MRKFCLLLAACMVSMFAFAQSDNSSQSSDAPVITGVTWARGVLHDTYAGSTINMTWHNGKILTKSTVAAIFWGTSWAHYTGDKISGMDAWYQGFGNSDYAKTSDEYTGSNGQVGAALTYQGHYIDTTPAANGSNSYAINLEVCKMIANPDPSGNGYYPVYVDVPRGGNGYCAYHAYGRCHGVNVTYAFFFDLDGDGGCDPRDTSGLHSQGLAAIANVSGHELSETRTDPTNGGWYDASHGENGDKCAWTFGAPLVTFSNGTRWKIQGEWSNYAYNHHSGYRLGCVSGL